MDFPNDWYVSLHSGKSLIVLSRPDLLTTLFSTTCNLPLAAKPKGLLCLHHVLESLRSRCLFNAKRQLRQVLRLFISLIRVDYSGDIPIYHSSLEREHDKSIRMLD